MESNGKAVQRRLRLAVSCQRCRRIKSKCSRTRPQCNQCASAKAECEYLDVPGDLENAALRDRFAGLGGQIETLMAEWGALESLVSQQSRPFTHTEALRAWSIRRQPSGLTIDTHTDHVNAIYDALIQFGLDNSPRATLPAASAWLTRNNTIYPTLKLSHFTSLSPANNETSAENEVTDDDLPAPLPVNMLRAIFDLYKTCLLYGSMSSLDDILDMLLDADKVQGSVVLQLLLTSIVCYMLPHSHCWHSHIFPSSATRDTCHRLARQHHALAKHLLSSLYFEGPSLLTCHAICNIALYHVECGNTSLVYLYSGMAVRMALSLGLHDPGGLEAAAQAQEIAWMDTTRATEYVRSLFFFLFFLDTATAHLHDKPYHIQLDQLPSITLQSSLSSAATYSSSPSIFSHYQRLEFLSSEITRDIRHTCFANNIDQIPCEEIERIERRLKQAFTSLPHERGTALWETRYFYISWIRHYGHWILLHHLYIPAATSMEHCTTAALALADLFEAWIDLADCYFRPCVHELRQACDILLYLVDHDTTVKTKALQGLAVLLAVIFKTPVSDIARTRPFVQQVQQVLQLHGMQ